MLEVSHIKRPDFAYINLSDVKKIIDMDTKEEYVVISKKEYEELKNKLEKLKRSPSLF